MQDIFKSIFFRFSGKILIESNIKPIEDVSKFFNKKLFSVPNLSLYDKMLKINETKGFTLIELLVVEF